MISHESDNVLLSILPQDISSLLNTLILLCNRESRLWLRARRNSSPLVWTTTLKDVRLFSVTLLASSML